MRVKYGELSETERRLRRHVLTRAHEGWCRLRDGDRRGAEQVLCGVDSRIALDISELDGGVSVAELTAFEPSAWPLAELMLAQAPSDVGYVLSLGRAPLSIAQALAETEAEHGIDFRRAAVRAGFGRGHLLEITFALPGGNGSEIEQNAAENLTRALLGDRWFDVWIGAVHVTPAPRGGPLRVLDVTASRHALDLHELFDTVAAAALGVLRGLPALRGSSRHGSVTSSALDDTVVERDSEVNTREDWTLLEIEPVSDAGALDKSDLVLASSCTPELLRCYLEGSPCASRRFTREGGHFVYVAYPDEERSMQRRVAKRTVIEKALSECATDLYAITGLGLGVKSTYLDLILFNLEMGLPELISKVRELELPTESCIRFFDTELADEWVSIGPDTNIVRD